MTNKVTVTFLLDETGSMESIADDTIGGFNHYLGRLQALEPGARAGLSFRPARPTAARRSPRTRRPG